jgi:hypothetical protein
MLNKTKAIATNNLTNLQSFIQKQDDTAGSKLTAVFCLACLFSFSLLIILNLI